MGGIYILRRILLVFVFVTALFISACSDNESHIYIGEGDNWEVNYGRDGNFSIEYIGDGSIPEGEINYIIEQGTRTTDGNGFLLNEEGKMNVNRPISEGKEDIVIKVTIDWNGESESIKLVKQ